MSIIQIGDDSMFEYAESKDKVYIVVGSDKFISFPKSYMSDIPRDTLDGLIRWYLTGEPSGDFLKSVLKNDLVGAVCKADKSNFRALEHITKFVYNYMPSSSWGAYSYQYWGGVLNDDE